jgi:hypothetical protein
MNHHLYDGDTTVHDDDRNIISTVRSVRLSSSSLSFPLLNQIRGLVRRQRQRRNATPDSLLLHWFLLGLYTYTCLAQCLCHCLHSEPRQQSAGPTLSTPERILDPGFCSNTHICSPQQIKNSTPNVCITQWIGNTSDISETNY